jgi:hypothetical protein
VRLRRLEPPVVFRPHESELLSSWIARIAGAYHIDTATLLAQCSDLRLSELAEIDLNPSLLCLNRLSQLAQMDVQQLERHTVRGLYPAWLRDWVTLRPLEWNASDARSVRSPGVLFNVCQACLFDDLTLGGGQFIRLEWLCVATTVCGKHLIPFATCENIDSTSTPFECLHTQAGARFFSRGNCQPLDSYGQHSPEKNVFVLLSGFEQTIKGALSVAPAAAVPGFPTASAQELLSVVKDLTWTLMQPVSPDGTRLLHCFQTSAFPVPRGLRVGVAVPTLSRANLLLRRAILSVIACLLEPEQFCEISAGSCYVGRPFAYPKFLEILGVNQATMFLSKAHRWPRDFRETMWRAALDREFY